MELQAPPVIVVLVTCDPGPWFEASLVSLADQDYPNMATVVIDAGSVTDPSGRVAAILPDARILRLDKNEGYSVAANAALELTRVSTHLLFCHDDVSPAPDAVRLMVEEAFRSNAGIVAPKLVAWDQPDRLLQVGMAVTRGGAVTPRVERGELDQQQHDAVRDVFVAPGGVTLVRSDLFASLGGFDPGIDMLGEDVDLCWRAHIMGARVIVAPQARVAHLEAFSNGARRPSGTSRGEGMVMQMALARRHQLRTVLKAYRPWNLARILPQLGLVSLVEVVICWFTHRPELARAISGAWRWNLSRRREIRKARSVLQSSRILSDHSLSHLQVGVVAGLLARRHSPSASGWPGWHSPWPSAPPTRKAPSPEGGPPGALTPAQRAPAPDPAAKRRWLPGTVAWAAVLVLMVFGSRQLATTSFPVIGQLAHWPSWTTFLRDFFGGWRSTGLGASAPAPLAFAMAGLGGMLVAGHMGFLQHLAVLGTLPLGALGAWYLGRPLPSSWARTVTMVVYAVVPLPYGALGLGRWDVLVAYAVAPWVLGLLLGATGLEPFSVRARRALNRRSGSSQAFHHGPANTGPRRLGTLGRCSLSLAALLAVTGAFAPSEVAVVLISAIGLLAGSVFTGRGRPGLRSLAAAVLGVAGAIVLSEPWSFGLLNPGHNLAVLGGAGSVDPAGVGQLLALRVGGVGVTPLAWGLVAAALLPLLIGQQWRFTWASRLWGVSVACWVAAWLGGKGWLGLSVPTGVLLAGAAAAVALCAGLGVVAFQQDLVTFRFGWRQAVSLLAATGMAVGTFSFLGAAVGGRWGLPSQDYSQVLSWMPACAAGSGGTACQLGGVKAAQGGAFRVLWLGNPEALPMGSWSLGHDLAFATSENGPPDATYLLAPGTEGPARLLARDVDLATADLTSSLGHLLAPLAVRYIVVPTQLDPATGSLALPPPASLTKVLGSQTDLLQLSANPSIMVFANTAWVPQRAELTPAAATESVSAGPAGGLRVPLVGSVPVLAGPAGALSFTGILPTGSVYLSAGSSRWQLVQAGGPIAPSQPAFGWANIFAVTHPGLATLRFRTPVLYLVAIAVDCALWLLALSVLFVRSDRRGRRRVGILEPGARRDGEPLSSPVGVR